MPVPAITLTLPDWIDEEVGSRAYASDEERVALAIRLSRRNVAEPGGRPLHGDRHLHHDRRAQRLRDPLDPARAQGLAGWRGSSR